MYSVTAAFINWLNTYGYNAHSYPPDDGTEFVTVERTGGGVSDMVDHPTIAVQTWAQTEERAEDMANEIRYLVLTEAPPNGVHGVVINTGPYRFYDEYTRLPRFQLVLDVVSQLTE
jgi:hypothetical protein